MGKGLTALKWVLIDWPKITQMPQNLPVQLVYPCPKVLDFNEKRLHWVSAVRGRKSLMKKCNLNRQTLNLEIV